MNKFYIIIPLGLMLVFGVYYTKIAKPEMLAHEQAEQQRIQAEKEAEDAHRKEIEAKAQADAQKAQADREEKERQRQEKLHQEKEDRDRRLREETAKYEGEAATLSKQISDLEIKLTDLRNQRETMNHDVFEAAKKVELAKIARQNAEMEIQRMYDIVAQKVADSSLTKVPPPPPPPK